MKCDRCKQDTNAYTGSWFNMDRICLACSELESQHPLFEHARDMEIAEVMKRNYNYEGIGLPPELEPKEES